MYLELSIYAIEAVKITLNIFIEKTMFIEESDRIRGISEYYFSQKLQQIALMNSEGIPVINLGIGSPDLPPQPEIIEELRYWAGLPHIHGYQSYRGLPELRQAIAGWQAQIYNTYHNPDTEILPLIGSKEGIMHISQAFVNEGDTVLLPNPGYPTYRSVSQIVGANIKTYNLQVENDELPALNCAEIADLCDNRTKILWLNTPHMPTGVSIDPHTLQQLVEIARQKRFIIVNDNPYSTILTDTYCSIFQCKNADEVCLELNSLSKSHNMAGWRIGWVAGHKHLIDSILKVKSNMDSGMFLPLQKAALKALQADPKFIDGINAIYNNRRIIVYEILKYLGCSYKPNRGGLFVWAKMPADITEKSVEFCDKILLETRVFITPGSIFGSNGEGFVRVSLCNTEEILHVALERIKKCF